MSECTPSGPARALRGRHRPDCQNAALTCAGCEPCPELHCTVCRRTHADHVCPHCLRQVRTTLARLKYLARKLPGEATRNHGAYATGNNIPGGDALVLAGPGASPEQIRRALDERLLLQLDTSHAQEESRADPRPPATVLAYWTRTWRDHLDQPTTLTITLDRAADYIDTQLPHLTDDPRFIVMARELGDALRRVEDALHEGDRPQTSRVPCWECGTRLVKVYTAREDDDHWLCPHCGELYDQARFDRAKEDHLTSTGADRFVSVTDATEAIGRPVQTVRAWIRRGMVEVSRDERTGRLLAWWPDVRNLHLTQQVRVRQTRPPAP